MVFIDSNIPMYVAGKDHPNRAPARAFLERVGSGEVEACTSTEVLQEILYRYAGLGRLDLAEQVYDLFVEICPIVLAVTLADTDRGKALLLEVPHVGVRDCLHAAVMLNQDIGEIATFDRTFEQIPGIELYALT